MKTCNTCLVQLPLSEFSRCATHPDGLQYRCRTCASAYHAANRARITAHKRASYAAYPEKTLRAQREFKAKNPERVRQQKQTYASKNSVRLTAKTAEWRRNNPIKYRLQCAKNMARRRAKLRSATPSWADSAKIDEFYFAADFLGMVTGIWHEVDHVVPLASKLVCGLHCEQNLQVLPASDNRKKSNRYWPDMPERCNIPNTKP